MMSLLVLLLSLPALAQEVVCTLPWLGDVTRVLAPEAEITVLVQGTEDPHHLSPTPALTAKVGSADLYVENGLGLEPWSAALLDGAGNPGILPGQPGFVRASQGVTRLEVPSGATPATGDLHPEGNPHIWLDPLNVPIVADNIAAGLARIDPENGEAYVERAKTFRHEVQVRTYGEELVGSLGGDVLDGLARGGKLYDFLESKGLSDRLGGWLGEGAALRGRSMVFHHRSWAYFIDRFGLRVVDYIEVRPGIAPSAAHLDGVKMTIQFSGAKVIGVTSCYDDQHARVLAEETGATLVRLPGDVGGIPEVSDYYALIDTLVARLGE
ncbi:MAG: zinc ABC transporter substrate-binding protein [Deltaproteobacteria bacterium]|nr:zinc ABC transporter substrate-binding protein [Deltaproteobacteria bacterium]MBW2254138.1 zinc ABC transporter substrate-binding protein [Deltaproteobacteria bacterium]